MKKLSKETKCVHSGAIHDHNSGVNTPLFNSTAFGYINEDLLRYPRYSNIPNHDSVARKIADLENSESALIFSSGMAAISTTILGLLNAGDHIIATNNLYGGTLNFLHKDLERFGIQYSILDNNTIESMEEAIQSNTKMVYLESPSNPLLEIIDLKKVAAWAQSNKIISCIDNTFGTPINQNPVALGIDISIHSATKYLGGHSDICAGAVCSESEIIKNIKSTSHNLGGSLNAFMCFLLEKNLKTLAIRVKAQNENAMELAQFLNGLSEIDQVYYPGLASHPGHHIAQNQMSGFGGMLSFELLEKDPINFQKKLQLIKPAMSLGGIESTMCSPSMTSHQKISEEERNAFGIKQNLIRFSIGIENAEDLKTDILQALDQASPLGPPKFIGNAASGN